MLNNPTEISDFKDFSAGGGLLSPPNVAKGQTAIATGNTLSANLSASIDSSVDYVVDGISELPQLILSISSEGNLSSQRVNSWVDYIKSSSSPIDLEQVAQGVDIDCKMKGIENNKPAASILPITSAIEIDALNNTIKVVESDESEIVDLMGRVNSALQGIEVPPTPPATEPTITPPPPLPEPLKVEALNMIERLKKTVGLIGRDSLIIATMNSKASEERTRAIALFNEAITFTLVSNQKSNPAIQSAIEQMYPES